MKLWRRRRADPVTDYHRRLEHCQAKIVKLMPQVVIAFRQLYELEVEGERVPGSRFEEVTGLPHGAARLFLEEVANGFSEAAESAASTSQVFTPHNAAHLPS